MPKIDPRTAEESSGSRYPPPYDEPCRSRRWKRLGDAAGLTQFGVNLMILEPGVWSSQRHWHSHEDEFVYVLRGQPTLITNAGEETLQPGDAAGFKAGEPDGHSFVNRTGEPVQLLIVGSRNDADCGEYSDIDMICPAGRYSAGARFTRRDGRRIE